MDLNTHSSRKKGRMPSFLMQERERRTVSLLLDSGFLFEVSGRQGGDVRILVRFTTSRGMRCLAGAAVPCRGYPPSRPRSAAGTHIFGINLVFVPRKFNINDTSKSGQENMQQSSSCVHGGKQKKNNCFFKVLEQVFHSHICWKNSIATNLCKIFFASTARHFPENGAIGFL